MGIRDKFGNPLGDPSKNRPQSTNKKSFSQTKGVRPFTRFIGPNGPEGDVHSSPGVSWVVTILRWDNRDTAFMKGDFIKTRQPLVIVNDCIQVKVSNSKNSPTQAAELVLKGGDINYSTAVAPGDYIFINMLDSEKAALNVRDKALGTTGAVNSYFDGLKFVGKIASVRKNLQIVDPNDRGKKILTYKISAHSFTEFNNKIYFNPTLTDNDGRLLRYLSHLSDEFNQMVGDKRLTNCHEILKAFIVLFLGNKPGDGVLKNSTAKITPNEIYEVPNRYSSLLNRTGNRYINNISVLMGVQEYSLGSSNRTPAAGFNPKFKELFQTLKANLRTIKETTTPIQGESVIATDLWNNVSVWSIFKKYLNENINEMYTTLRVSPTNDIIPTFVVRQIPFTTEHYRNRTKKDDINTRFLTLPRWKIDPALIFSSNIGREDAARVNFVQVFGQYARADSQTLYINAQNAKGNYQLDGDDIKRNGLRPLIKTSNHDLISESRTGEVKGLTFKAPLWATLIADWVFAGHLKLNGSITCYGIVEPIAVGDNLEYDDIVYHIEQVDHFCLINVEGKKQFRTTISLSNGVHKNNTKDKVIYGEMDNTDSLGDLRRDNANDRLLPGVTDVQDLPGRGRNNGEETRETPQKSFNTGYEQKNLGKSGDSKNSTPRNLNKKKKK